MILVLRGREKMKCPKCNQEGYNYQHLLMHDYMDRWIKMNRKDKK